MKSYNNTLPRYGAETSLRSYVLAGESTLTYLVDPHTSSRKALSKSEKITLAQRCPPCDPCEGRKQVCYKWLAGVQECVGYTRTCPGGGERPCCPPGCRNCQQ